MAEVAIPRQMFQEYCGSSRNCGRSRHLRQHETFDVHAFKGNRREECAQSPEKWPDQVARPSSGGRGMEAAVGTAHRSCGKAGKVFNLHANSGSSGECRIKEVIMADNVLYRFSGQACYEVDTGRLKKIRV